MQFASGALPNSNTPTQPSLAFADTEASQITLADLNFDEISINSPIHLLLESEVLNALGSRTTLKTIDSIRADQVCPSVIYPFSKPPSSFNDTQWYLGVGEDIGDEQNLILASATPKMRKNGLVFTVAILSSSHSSIHDVDTEEALDHIKYNCLLKAPLVTLSELYRLRLLQVEIREEGVGAKHTLFESPLLNCLDQELRLLHNTRSLANENEVKPHPVVVDLVVISRALIERADAEVEKLAHSDRKEFISLWSELIPDAVSIGEKAANGKPRRLLNKLVAIGFKILLHAGWVDDHHFANFMRELSDYPRERDTFRLFAALHCGKRSPVTN